MDKTRREPVEPEKIEGSFVSTGNVGIAPDTAGDAAGKIYAEYKLVANEEDISLAAKKCRVHQSKSWRRWRMERLNC